MRAILQTLGRNIRNIRKEIGCTQQTLGERAGICSKFISELERGKRNPSYIVLYKIAGALEKEVSDLLSIDKMPSEKAIHIERIVGLLKDRDASDIGNIVEGLELLLDMRTQKGNGN